MPRYKNSLRLSVSTIALLVGAGITETPSYAVTISSNQTGYTASGSITDGLIIASGVSVSPDGVLIDIGGKNQFTGDLVNNGTVEVLIDDEPDITFSNEAIYVPGTLNGNVTNGGTINASEVAEDHFTETLDVKGDSNTSDGLFTSSATMGIYVGTLTGDFTNTGKITSSAVSTSSYSSTVNATGTGENGASSLGFANADGVRLVNFTGTFSNAKGGTISADAASSTTAAASMTAGDADAEHGDFFIRPNAVAVYLGDTSSSDLMDAIQNAGTISASIDANLGISAMAVSSTGPARAGWGTLVTDGGAVGITMDDHVGAFSNAGTITTKANSVTTVDASASGTSALVIGGGVSSSTPGAGALGVVTYVDSTASNDGNIEATAASSASYKVAATASNGDAIIDMDSPSGGADAIGFAQYNDATTAVIMNTGSVKASASTKYDRVATVAATKGNASYYNAGWDFEVGALGIVALGADDITNAGTVTVAAYSAESLNAVVSGVTADVTLGFTQQDATATGIDVSNLAGDFANNGAVSVTGQFDSATTVSATATSGPATVNQSASGDFVVAGISIDSLDGAFASTKDITASNTTTITQSLAAAGDVNSTIASNNDFLVQSLGVTLGVGLTPVTGAVSNGAKITATVNATFNQQVSTTAGGKAGLIDVDNEISVSAVGLRESISVTNKAVNSFANTGTVAADATLTLTVPAQAEGSTIETDTSLAAAGVLLSGAIGNVTNSGTISAAVHLKADKATGAAIHGDVVGLWVTTPGAATVITNSGDISANLDGVGKADIPVAAVYLDFYLPIWNPDVKAGETITFTNSGKITGSSTLGDSYGIFAEDAHFPLVINQQGGSIKAATAIAINQDNADTLNWTGGEIHGVVDADSKDVVNVVAGTGTPASKTISAGTDFTLEGAGELNIGNKGAPVTFVMNGLVTNVGETNLNTDGKLVVGPTAKIDTGTFNQNDASTLVIQFSPTTAGLITTTGDFNADGNLQTQALVGLYGDKGSHIVIDAGGVVAGKFDTVATVGDTLLIDFTTTVNPTDVVVSWERNGFNEVKGLSDNSGAVAGALEDGYNPTRQPSKNTPELNDQLSGLFTLTDAEKYDRVLNSWSGSEHAQVMRAAANLSEPYLMAIGEHLNDNRNTGFREQNVVMLRPKGSSGQIAPATSVGASGGEETGFAFWGRAFGRWASTRGDSNADGFDEDTYGAVLGMDFQLSPTALLGIAGSYVDDDMNFDDGDSGKIKRWSIGGYASATFDAFYIDGSFTYARDSYRVHRTIITGGAACLSYTCSTGAASRYSGDGLIAHAEVGFNWKLGEGARLQPFAGLNYTSIDTDPFAETGGGDLGLEVLDGTGKSFQSRLGARLSGDWGSGDVKWVPELRAEWRHEFENDPAWIVANLVGVPNEPFTTVGSHVGRDLAVIGAGVTAQMASGWGLYLDYQGAFASGYHSHVVQGGVRVRF